MMLRKLAERPCSADRPWSLVIYSDEIVPGNALAFQHRRKLWAIYVSFLEFEEHLNNEYAWIPIVAVRTSQLKNVVSGISQVFAVVLKVFFGKLLTYDFRTGGAQLKAPDGSTFRFWATLAMFIQDGAAQKSVWGCKGDAGTRCCMLCANVVSRSSALAPTDASESLVCSIVHEKGMILVTAQSIRRSLQRLLAFKDIVTASEYRLREQAIGFILLERGVLMDPALDDIVFPAQQYMHDWMHMVFSSGLFNISIYLCVVELHTTHPTIWASINQYVKTWTWPAFPSKFNPGTVDPFSAAKVKAFKDGSAIKCTASEGLSMLPVLSRFFDLLFAKGGCPPALHKIIVSLADMVDLLSTAALGLTTPARLRSVIASFLEATVDAGFREYMIPKYHWVLHFPGHISKFGRTLTCWVHERKHKMIKAAANDTQNTKAYSKSVLSESLTRQLVVAAGEDQFSTAAGLIKPHKANKHIASLVASSLGLPLHASEILSSVGARLNVIQCIGAEDVIMLKNLTGNGFVAAKVQVFVSIQGRDLALIDMMQLHIADHDQSSSVWKLGHGLALVELGQCLAAVIWSPASEGLVRILHPFQFNGLKATLELP